MDINPPKAGIFDVLSESDMYILWLFLTIVSKGMWESVDKCDRIVGLSVIYYECSGK